MKEEIFMIRDPCIMRIYTIMLPTKAHKCIEIIFYTHWTTTCFGQPCDLLQGYKILVFYIPENHHVFDEKYRSSLCIWNNFSILVCICWFHSCMYKCFIYRNRGSLLKHKTSIGYDFRVQKLFATWCGRTWLKTLTACGFRPLVLVCHIALG